MSLLRVRGSEPPFPITDQQILTRCRIGLSRFVEEMEAGRQGAVRPKEKT
jgi:hypothetical protein